MNLNEVPAAKMREFAQHAADNLTAEKDRILFNLVIALCKDQACLGQFQLTEFNTQTVLQLQSNPRVLAKLEKLGYAVQITDTSDELADVPYYKLSIMW